jgi:hypothetical protein
MRATLKVNSTGTVDISIQYAISKSMASLAGTDSILDEENIKSLQEQGYTCTPYSDGDYDGYVLTKHEVPDFKEGIFNNPASLTKEGSKYIIDIPWNTNDEESSAAQLAAAGAMISSQGGYAEVVLILPVKPISHNASYVSEDGKTLTWNLLTMGSKSSLHVEYDINSFVVLWLIRIAIAIAIVAVAAVLIIVIIKLLKKRGKKSDVGRTTDDLREYKKMLDDGLITQEEYDFKKTELLNISRPERKPDEKTANESESGSNE